MYADSLYPIDGLAGHLTLDRDENLEFRFAPPESGYSIPRFDLPFDLKSELDPTLPPSPSLRFLESLNYFPPELGNVLPSPESVHVQKDVPKNNQENENRIEICGRFENALHSAHGEITLKASTIPINAKLINTIPEKQRRVVQSLHPEGWISMSVSLEFPKDKSRPVEKHFVIGAENCSICYDLFPYPIRGINGIIEWNGDDWTFSNFTGDNESTKVQAKGFMKKRPEGLVLYLKIYATDLPLEGRLKEALKNPSHREIHHSLRGTGKVNVDAQVFYFPASKKLNVSFEAEPEKKQGLTIRPINFPLRIENVHGQIRFDNGDFTVKNMKGRSKDAKISSDVNCRFEKNGAWNMDISSIIVDQVQAKDTELLNAMPENLQVLIKNINPEGPINIAGAIHFSKTKTGAPLKTRWNATLTLFQNAANFGVPLNNIAGLVHLSGRTEDYQMKLFGDLELDSLFFNDVQLLNFRGPFRYDGERIFLGQNALGGTPSSSLASRGPVRYSGQAPEEFTFASLNQPGGDFQRGTNFSPLRSLQEEILESRNFGSGPSSNEFSQDAEFSGVPRPITANVFGGTAFCRGEVRVRQKNISYDLNLNLDNADLSHVVREWKSSSTASAPKKISGKLGVAARIRGEGRNLDTLSGEGSISLREAYLYETPMMIKLLQILSIREPRKSAFSSSDIFFRIQGKKAYLNPVRFQGDTFSLEGNGDVQLDGNRKISLILKTRLGNTKNRIPLLSDILGGAGEQLNEVHVEGSIDDPEIIRIPLPNVRKTIEQIQGT